MDEEIKYRSALGAFATGVALVTAEGPNGPVGIIINSFTSVSLDPRLILWCLGDKSDRYAEFAAAERWAVNILAADQKDISSRFARTGAKDAADTAFDRLEGVPALPGAAARFSCRTHERFKLGDHLVIVGEVVAYDGHDGAALTYHRGRYGASGGVE